MDKTEFFKIANNKDEKLIISRLIDVYENTNKCGYVKCSRFLNGREQKIANTLLSKLNCDFSFYGGYDDAERKIVICYSDVIYKDIYQPPLKIISIKCREVNKLNHRDYLGALMGLGIKRELFGDIIADEDGAKIISFEDMATYVSEQLTKVGKYNVTVSYDDLSEIHIPPRQFKEITFTVNSLRIDSVISGALGVSRSEASAIIDSGNVALDWEEVNSVSKTLTEGQLLSVKGHGRYLLEDANSYTKKGRIFVRIKKYI